MSLQRKLKTALDETRLLILGAQVLLGFQLNGSFQEAFAELPPPVRYAHCTGTILMTLALGLLIAPSMQHRLVEHGAETNRILAVTTRFAGVALLPIAVGLGLDVFVAVERALGMAVGVLAGSAVCALALLFWYGVEMIMKKAGPRPEQEKPTPLATKVDHLLTEARVIIPGAQALIGFQLTVTLTRAFEQLPTTPKLAHIVALACVVLAVILLMAPAALHRISFGGEDSPDFLKVASRFVIAAPFPLALGIALDVYVASGRAIGSTGAEIIGAGAFMMLIALWYAYPLWRRRSFAAA